MRKNMEDPCKLVLFGDSITDEYSKILQTRLLNDFPEVKWNVVNAGRRSETSRDGLNRLNSILELKPDVIVIGFGMNDWRYGVEKKEYKKNLLLMLEELENVGSRVIINTVSPSYDFEAEKYNTQTDEYSEVVRQIAHDKKLKIADIDALWARRFSDKKDGLRDHIHPNIDGKNTIVDCLTWVITRKHTTILWQYNGREAQCNYRCPYCYYIGLHNPSDRFTGYVDQWHERFKEAFRNQYLVFYLAFGEPTMGAQFPEIIKMIASEPKWQLRITSNVSMHLDLLINNQLAKEQRLFINASFHPYKVDIESFIKNITFLRDGGIDVSVV